jgi:hypothetical protein
VSLSRKKRIQEEVEKGRRNRRILTLVTAIVLVAITVSAVYLAIRPSSTSEFPFPCLAEGVQIHVHPWLRMEISNQSVTIPASIGIVRSFTGLCFEPIHTHDASGIIHVESNDVNTQYTLGDFFTIWRLTYASVLFQGQKRPIVFNSTDILGFTNDSTNQVKLLVNGNPDTTDWASLKLISLDYCSGNIGGVPPCSPTASGNPAYPGGYPYGTGHTIIIQYYPRYTSKDATRYRF